MGVRALFETILRCIDITVFGHVKQVSKIRVGGAYT